VSTRVTWHSGPAIRAVDTGGQVGLYAAGKVVLERANLHVPYMLGTLKDSGRVTVVAGEAIVSYDTAYAARLHEHPEYDFQNGREAKWLEHAHAESTEEAVQAIAVGIRGRL